VPETRPREAYGFVARRVRAAFQGAVGAIGNYTLQVTRCTQPLERTLTTSTVTSKGWGSETSFGLSTARIS
jgi:hypothetical protein